MDEKSYILTPQFTCPAFDVIALGKRIRNEKPLKRLLLIRRDLLCTLVNQGVNEIMDEKGYLSLNKIS